MVYVSFCNLKKIKLGEVFREEGDVWFQLQLWFFMLTAEQFPFYDYINLSISPLMNISPSFHPFIFFCLTDSFEVDSFRVLCYFHSPSECVLIQIQQLAEALGQRLYICIFCSTIGGSSLHPISYVYQPVFSISFHHLVLRLKTFANLGVKWLILLTCISLIGSKISLCLLQPMFLHACASGEPDM